MSHFSDHFSAVLDANVLYGALERDILLSLAGAGFYRPCWSVKILDEFEKAFATNRSDLEGARRQRKAIERAFPEACVEITEIDKTLELPDEDDKHVVYCAISSNAQVIVTENLKDFPRETLAIFGIEPIGFDDFVADVLDLSLPDAIMALRQMRMRLKNPRFTPIELIRVLEGKGHTETSNTLLQYQAFL